MLAARRGLLARLGGFLVGRPRRVLAGAALLVVVALPLGLDVSADLVSGGGTDPRGESSRVERILAREFHAGVPGLALVATAARSVDDREARRDGLRLTRSAAAAPGVESATSYWTTNDPALRSADGGSALVLIRSKGDEDARATVAEQIVPGLTGRQGALDVLATGPDETAVETKRHSETDLRRSELLSVLPTVAVLVLVFGSVGGALLPGLVGVLAMVATLAVLRLLSLTTDVSVYAVNVTTALGFGLAVDYSLLLLTRYREELRRGLPRPEAIVVSLSTAGRAVLFSAATGALALSGLLVFPLYFLRSIAYAGIAVVFLVAVLTLVVLPALLAVAGPRLDAWPVRVPFARTASPSAGGPWRWLAAAVMRRPWTVAVATTLFLLAMALPFLNVSFGLIDDRNLPASAQAHRAADLLRDRFTVRESTLSVYLPTTGSGASDRFAARISGLPGVRSVAAPGGVSGKAAGLVRRPSPSMTGPTGSWLSVSSDLEPGSPDGAELVRRIRALPGPALVGGRAAQLVDTRAAIGGRLPAALAIVGISAFVLLYLFTGSLLIPLKAIVLTLLSLCASFGAAVHVFQEGHLRWLLGDFTVTHQTDMLIPVLMFCVAFGLSMDYEVFLLSRIKESWEAGRDLHLAVADGLHGTGRLVTSAAAIIAVVFLAFAASGTTALKLLGVGLALAVIIDATIVRALLVPALMCLAGRANFWAPAPLRALHARLGLTES